MEGQSDAHFNHTFHLFFLSTNKCKEEILLLAFVHTSSLYGGLNRPKHISNENYACAMQGSFTLIWQHGTHGYHSLCFPSQIEDAPLLDLWPWAASAFTQRRCWKCFFICLFVFLFFCLVNAANTTAYVQKILLPDTNAAVLCDCIWSLFIARMIFTFPVIAADSSSNVPIPLQCTVFVRSMSQDSFTWCFLIGHVATFSCRHAFVLLLSRLSHLRLLIQLNLHN